MTRTIASANPRRETFFERHAWQVFLGMSTVIGLFGIGDMINGASDLQTGETVLMHSVTGTSWNELRAGHPKVARMIEVKFRTEGASLTMIACLSMIICLVGLRRGERWAWYTMWAFPAWAALTVFFFWQVDKEPGLGIPVPIYSGSFIFAVSVLMLGLSSGKLLRED